MSKKILVAYDGSELSKKAVLEAKNQACETPEREIHILSVIKPSGPVTNKAVSRSFGDEMKEKYEKDMKQIKQEVSAEGTHVITEIVIGDMDENPGKRICDYANRQNVDMIIVGSRGLGSVKKIFLGSVSNNVVQHASCPVMVLK